MSYDKPYAGLKVVDASLGIAGPHCGMLLALYGAEVIKIEPLFGDWVRPLGTTYAIIRRIRSPSAGASGAWRWISNPRKAATSPAGSPPRRTSSSRASGPASPTGWVSAIRP